MTDQAMPPDDLEWLGRLARLDQKLRLFQRVHCGGKFAFDNYDTAQRSLKKTKLGKLAHVYHCIHCHAWHVGNLTGTRERRLVKQRRMQHEE